ncbi:hypothetical protein VSH64_23600 [Amycolatopsis rhabdoformis]|uniref:Uncharacterized protein n=1 Tax=Amycolatopsis rhabdoformis TaxID=1448059 RepID=A0ABZ1INU3_9PSEU|nr:hypothetical protein [Amycolatopsis rhabdoformis]WSE35020.1 hypothetical protein VSH64_23600 [Amycolatopsis rhabdoformis]
MKLSNKIVATGLIAGALVLGGSTIASAQTVIASYDNEPACRVGLVLYAVGHQGASLDCQKITISGNETRYWLVQN